MNDVSTNENSELPKLPFRRVKFALNQLASVAIPLHVKTLQQHSENIKQLSSIDKELELHSEQAKAAKTIHLLRSDLFELEKLNSQVKEEDKELFNNIIKIPTRDAIDALSTFMELHSDILSPFPEKECSELKASEIPPLICDLTEDESSGELQQADLQQGDLQLQVLTSKHSFESLSFLQKELYEVNILIRQFASLLFKQKESVDTIENNIEQTRENVYHGAKYLKKASEYKAAVLPFAGALIGGLILGPAGALAGFKLSGSVACLATGGVLGYGAGLKLKQISNDVPVKALTYRSKSECDLTVENKPSDAT